MAGRVKCYVVIYSSLINIYLQILVLRPIFDKLYECFTTKVDIFIICKEINLSLFDMLNHCICI